MSGCYRTIEWVGYETAICGVHQVPWPCAFNEETYVPFHDWEHSADSMRCARCGRVWPPDEWASEQGPCRSERPQNRRVMGGYLLSLSHKETQ